VETGTFSLTAGSTWQVTDRQADHVTLAASFGQIYVMSQKVDHPLTVEAAFSRVESDLKAKHPSVASWIDPDAFAVGDLDGQVRGYDYETRTPGGEAVGVCDAIWIGTDRSGHVCMLEQIATHDQFEAALEPAAAAVRASVQWRLR
jgi:hypothetical protein